MRNVWPIFHRVPPSFRMFAGCALYKAGGGCIVPEVEVKLRFESTKTIPKLVLVDGKFSIHQHIFGGYYWTKTWVFQLQLSIPQAHCNCWEFWSCAATNGAPFVARVTLHPPERRPNTTELAPLRGVRIVETAGGGVFQEAFVWRGESSGSGGRSGVWGRSTKKNQLLNVSKKELNTKQPKKIKQVGYDG